MSFKNYVNHFPANDMNGQNSNIQNKVLSNNIHLHHFHLVRKENAQNRMLENKKSTQYKTSTIREKFAQKFQVF